MQQVTDWVSQSGFGVTNSAEFKIPDTQLEHLTRSAEHKCFDIEPVVTLSLHGPLL